ncbi:uncharacterized protein LOC126650988 isoform X1 [Myiozetetes cayanensis]|uniref:uncharacterized protein LOC126650988 isoform X1 n=1 Tax=Myiozetetes cayanensis TaxID=478635 RepID=UPI00215FBE90|nr:uncharacterized protein LOC126650988 isoform X1 [Myiozetetes cayanensis]XP_050192380.1 uncharacterized protein LOC126650988 isoform X1 [Myiozetetes cayanensis]
MFPIYLGGVCSAGKHSLIPRRAWNVARSIHLARLRWDHARERTAQPQELLARPGANTPGHLHSGHLHWVRLRLRSPCLPASSLPQHPPAAPERDTRRMERHADGLFHSELSKMNGNAYVRQLVKHLVGLKDSSPGPVNTDMQEREGEDSPKELCFLWLYQSFLNTSHSDRDAQEAAAVTSQYLCPISKLLVADMKEDTDGSD